MFWSSSAGPTFFQLLNPFESGGRLLRTEPAAKPSSWKEIVQPIVCNRTNAKELTEFLCKEYKGDDWTLDLSVEWMSQRLSSDTLALIVKERDEIIGCILSRPLGGTLFGTGSPLTNVRVIEGLCVRSDRRGDHLAGWLIAWADYYTSLHQPIAHLWFRELSTASSFSTAVQVETYSYLKTKSILYNVTPMVQLAYDVWSPIWKEFRFDGVYSDGILDPDDILCFSRVATEISVQSMVIIVNTHRRTVDGCVWEVLWCKHNTDSRFRLNGTAFQLEATGKGGLLFATDALEHGGVTREYPSPWIVGTAGLHYTYFYNYIPSVRPIRLVALRGCI